jgi:pimeloyl-ACP methyl ester carboxylesterase
VPRQAYDDPEVRPAGEERVGMIELADVVAPGELGVEVAPMLAPFPCDLALAAEHQAEHRSAADAAELATVPGGAERMAHALVEAVRPGLAGVAADAEAQARPLAVDLAAVACPVHLWYGTADVVTPPAFGRWYAAHLPGASLAVVEGAAHYLAFTAWPDLLATLAADVVR